MLIVKIKNLITKTLIRLLNAEDVKAALALQRAESSQKIAQLNNISSPYINTKPLAVENTPKKTCERDDIIIISSRFRSGSTVLWNMFRQDPKNTAYYEPFNERKWFLQNQRGENVDSTHLGVSDYWSEFNNMEDLDNLYQNHWIHRNLHMDKNSWDPKMKKFICQLVERAKGRPILQFNRIDFRLPWLKHHFPNAKFLHLYRHPRDQWLSFLTDKKLMNKDKVKDTYQDAFYLDIWCQDLSQHFPFLSKNATPHPYQRFYYLWKLSYLYGLKCSDLSVSFEDLVLAKHQTTNNIIETFSLDTDKEAMCHVVEPLEMNKWKSYADEEWFKNIEDKCENVLNYWFNSVHRK
jgi:hypothetical protein